MRAAKQAQGVSEPLGKCSNLGQDTLPVERVAGADEDYAVKLVDSIPHRLPNFAARHGMLREKEHRDTIAVQRFVKLTGKRLIGSTIVDECGLKHLFNDAAIQ
jgi:hypothetical protein